MKKQQSLILAALKMFEVLLKNIARYLICILL